MQRGTEMSGREGGTAWSRVTAITVAYNSAAVIGRCLASVAPAARIIVVDNASRDDTIARAKASLPTAKILESGGNLGFGRGNNIGLEQVGTEFALLINPDAALRPGAIEALVDAADSSPESAVIGPAVMSEAGEVRLSHDVSYIDRARYPRKRTMEPAPEGPFCTWALSGAVMLLRMAALHEIGLFDPNIFLYFEDNDLCERIRRAGHSLIQEPAAVSDHLEGRSAAPSLCTVWITNRSFAWSRLYFVGKHWGQARAWRTLGAHLPRFLLRIVVRTAMLRPRPAFAAAAHVAGMARWAVGVGSDAAPGRTARLSHGS